MRRLCSALLAVSLFWTFPSRSFEAQAFEATFGLSPDNSGALLIRTIASARSSLLINIYEFTRPEICDAVIDRINQGVETSILIEGKPVSGLSAPGKKILKRLVEAMSKHNNNHLFVMRATSTDVKRRFNYDHAKYVVIDGARALVASENFSPSGHPAPGKIGNRGWEVVLENSDIATELSATFRADTDLKFGDIEELTQPVLDGIPLPANGEVKESAARVVPSFPIGKGRIESSHLITSPNSVQGLVEFINSARTHLELEHMSMPSLWREDGSAATSLNPIVAALIKAAERGVRVRTLLNDDHTFDRPGSSVSPDAPAKIGANEKTSRLLLAYAKCHSLSIQSKIVDTAATGITYIHNKGLLADGVRALVSSINGTKNAVMNNREVAVELESPDAATYYQSAFDQDWNASKPLSNADPSTIDTSCPTLPPPYRPNFLGRFSDVLSVANWLAE